MENDNRLYNRLINEYIQPITSDIYSKFSSSKVFFSRVIKFIKQNEVDNKIVSWISMKLGTNYVKEITFDISIPPIKEEVTPKKEMPDVTIDHEMDVIWVKKQEDTISDDLKPAISFGFSTLSFILMMLTISLVLGTILGYMILK